VQSEKKRFIIYQFERKKDENKNSIQLYCKKEDVYLKDRMRFYNG
jgi:hypothetical protein